MEYTQILYETVGRVARVTLDRPEYRNPIGRITIEEMDHAFSRAVSDDEVRVAHGAVSDGQFVALYGRAGRLVAALGFNWARPVMGCRAMIAEAALNHASQTQ